MDNVVLHELFEDIDWNGIQIAVEELAAPMYINPIREKPTYNENYVALTIPNYTLSEFKSHFRMSRQNFTELCLAVAPLIPNRHIKISLEAKLLFYIWLIAKQESFLAVSDRLGFSKGTGHFIFLQILNSITRLKDEYIRWPDVNECTRIALRNENRYNFPGLLGSIDGCHIDIKQPVNNAVDFYNRKEHHSIILQGVCDDKCNFTDVFIGMPGRVHDARVFRNSPLYRRIISNPPFILPSQHLLADAAYPLMINVLKPYRDNGHLSEVQIRFNNVLSAQRSNIERAFGLLKGKWRRLKYLDMALADKIPEVILSACILHNFILKQNDEEYQIQEADNDNIMNMNIYEEDENEDASGRMKRDFIARIL